MKAKCTAVTKKKGPCNHEWYYKGKKEEWERTTCPKCYNKVVIKGIKENYKLKKRQGANLV